MLEVGFIFPSSDYLFDPFRGDPFVHFQLLTILEDHFGRDVEARLVDLRGIKRDSAIYHIPECDVYLHSVYTLDYEEQCSIVKSLRSHYPRARHIAGGPHANMFTQESLEVFDALILGEGERTVIQALEDFMGQRLERIYRDPKPVDINIYPHWRRHFLPASATARKSVMNLKHKMGYEELLGTTAMFSRGCPYRCHFCAIEYARLEVPGIRYRAPERVEEEIEYLKSQYGIQGLSLSDEIVLPLKEDQAQRHLEAIGRTSIVWRGQCRVDGITSSLAALARQSGCMAMGLGVESVWQRSLDIINKRTTVEGAKNTIRVLKENDIEARIYLIIGLPGEPEDIVERTWSFIEETQPDLVYLAIFTLRPGTEVYNHPERFGIREVLRDWKKMMHQHGKYRDELPQLTFVYEEETPWGRSMTPEQIIKNYTELLQRLRERGLNSFEFFGGKVETRSQPA